VISMGASKNQGTPVKILPIEEMKWRLGLTEIRLLTCLSQGAKSPLTLSLQTNIPYDSCVLMLRKLKKLGLVETFFYLQEASPNQYGIPTYKLAITCLEFSFEDGICSLWSERVPHAVGA